MAVATHTQPMDIYVAETKRNSKPQQLTRLNQELLAAAVPAKPEEVIFRGYDGYPIHGWILKPYNFSKTKRYASILQIHGGPRVQYGNTFFHEMQFLAAQGYVVYYANPRGGQGYGEKHADFITGKWGTVDYEDCMAFADFMEKKP
jgi:dipeptidyl aminopeptidase/acylaminoacyl peptidase